MPHNVTAFRIILVLLLANIIACSDNLRLRENLHLDLTESSIGPITSQTPYELLEIVELFPSFEVKEVTKYESNFPVTYITISSSSKELINIYPSSLSNKVESISIRDKIVINKLGPKLGALYGEIYNSIDPSTCIRNSIKKVSFITCQAPNSKQVWYVFSKVWIAEKSEFPPITALKFWPLSEFIWRPITEDVIYVDNNN